MTFNAQLISQGLLFRLSSLFSLCRSYIDGSDRLLYLSSETIYYGLAGKVERRPPIPEPPPDLLLDATPWPGFPEEEKQINSTGVQQ